MSNRTAEIDNPMVVVEPPSRRLELGASLAVVVAALAALIVLGGGLFMPVANELKGASVVGLMLVLLVLRVPVGLAMGVPGVVAIWSVSGDLSFRRVLGDMPFSTVSSWALSVLPMFILMGLVLWRSGITAEIYRAAKCWLAWLPGGLAVTTNFAGAGMAAASGSTTGITYALGRIGIPEMLKAGYDRRLTTGSVLMAGTGGQLIPPSILLVVYAGVANVPVGPQLLAGLVPGILLAILYGILIVVRATLRPELAPRESAVKYRWSERFKALTGVWPIPTLMIIVLGGLYAGFFTATEAGAFGALGAILITIWHVRSMNVLRVLNVALLDTVVAVGSIFFLLVGAAIMSRSLAVTGLATSVARELQALGLDRFQFLLVVLVLYLVLGLFMEPIAMILLTVPVLMPIASALDISLLWFGVFVVLLGELAILTPPVGILTFIVHKITLDESIRKVQHISLVDVFRGALFFIPATILLLLLLIWFPDLATWLPSKEG